MTATALPFVADGKSFDLAELRSGDLELRGYAAVWKGLDAEAENFLRGAFRDAIPTFLAGSAPLAFNHDGSKIIGRVLDLQEDGYGVKIRARVDRQPPTSPVAWIVDAVKRGSIRALSAGGYFQRAQTALGRMIDKVLRLTEISVTATAQHPLTAFSVEEVKALRDGDRAARLRYERDLIRDVRQHADLLGMRLTVAAARPR